MRGSRRRQDSGGTNRVLVSVLAGLSSSVAVVEIKPRSLHCATRHAKGASRKKPGRFGRDDRISLRYLVLDVESNARQTGGDSGGRR